MADPDLELRGEPGLNFLALLAFFPSVISSFLAKIRGARAPQAPSLDPPLGTENKLFGSLRDSTKLINLDKSEGEYDMVSRNLSAIVEK